MADLDIAATFLMLSGVPGLAAMPELSDDAFVAARTATCIQHVAVYGAVDGNKTDNGFMMLQRQPPGNLFRRPLVFQKFFSDKLEKLRIGEPFMRRARFTSFGILLLGFRGEVLTAFAVPFQLAGDS